MVSGKLLSFPDRYLLRGLLTLVAINFMVPGIFGVAPPRWFDYRTLESNNKQVSAGKIDQPSTVLGQSASFAVDPDAQDQTKPMVIVDVAETLDLMTEDSEPGKASTHIYIYTHIYIVLYVAFSMFIDFPLNI